MRICKIIYYHESLEIQHSTGINIFKNFMGLAVSRNPLRVYQVSEDDWLTDLSTHIKKKERKKIELMYDIFLILPHHLSQVPVDMAWLIYQCT